MNSASPEPPNSNPLRHDAAAPAPPREPEPSVPASASNPKLPSNADAAASERAVEEAAIEEAIAELLIAEDEGQPLDIPAWLERHAAIRERLLAFLENQNRTTAALNSGSPQGHSSTDAASTPSHSDSRSASSAMMDTLEFHPSDPQLARGPAVPFEPIRRIGNYRLQRLLGSGGMGRVYEAVDEQGHRFAIKLIASFKHSSPETIERFRQEGKIASSLNHERCVFVHAADNADGQPFIAMELMPGSTLRDLVQSNGPMSVQDALAKILDVIDGLQAAHQKQLIHRDVKPSNCYLDANGRVKVGDFGLAKSVDSDAGLTRTGSIVGTPLFASPEQLRGEAIDLRSDIYSTCATLYYLLTGKAPFEHSQATTVIARALTEDPVPIQEIRRDVPEGLVRILAQGMQRNRELRPRDMLELREQLAIYVTGARRQAGLGLRFAAVCLDVAIISLVVAIVALLRPDWFATHSGRVPELRFESHALSSLLQALYIFVCEARFQTTLGKRLLGLRVDTADPQQSWSMGRAAIRVAVWWLCTGILSDGLLYASGNPLTATFDHPAQWIGYALGYAVLCLPLLWRSDRRLLHDLASGTQVDRVAEVASPSVALRLSSAAPSGPSSAAAVAHRAPHSKRFGRFVDAVPFLTLDGCVWYEGNDPALARRVWIAERSAEGPELPEARRRLARSARLRWITSAVEGDRRWDAFLAIPSIPVSELTPECGRIDWRTLRRGILDLCHEAVATDALHASSGPPRPNLSLDPSAVRIGREGSLSWLDDLGSSATHSAEVATRHHEREWLDVLRQAAMAMRDQVQRGAGEGSERRMLPYRAMVALERLDSEHPQAFQNVSQVADAFESIEPLPSNLTLRQKLLHIAPQVALGLMPFGAMLALLGAGHLIRMEHAHDELLRLHALKHVSQASQSTASVDALRAVAERNKKPFPDVASSDWQQDLARSIDHVQAIQRSERQRCSELDIASIRAAGILFVDSALIERLKVDDRLADGGAFVWKLPEEGLPHEVLEAELPAKEGDPREATTEEPLLPVPAASEQWFDRTGTLKPMWIVEAAQRVGREPYPLPNASAWRVALIALIGWVFLSLWGMLFRGGVGRKLAGLVLVDPRGKRAGYLRCLWRSMILWAPLGWMMLLIIVLESQGLLSVWLAFALRTACVLLPLVYVVVGLLSRGRSVHDQLAGTYLIPE